MRSAILTYHSLDLSGSVISLPPARFAGQMEFLSRSGVPVVPLAEAIHRPGSVALTFDDGFRNFAEHAVPVLEKYRFPAAVFIVSEFCGRHNDWNNGSHRIPRLPLLDWEELKALPPWISIGAHTATHRDLTKLDRAEADSELLRSREEIEQRLARRVEWLAYPYGASSGPVRQSAAAGFALAVGTALKYLPPRPDPMDLPRIDTYYFRGQSAFARLFSPAGPPYVALRHWLRQARTRMARA